jgi:hypothetical protein
MVNLNLWGGCGWFSLYLLPAITLHHPIMCNVNFAQSNPKVSMYKNPATLLLRAIVIIEHCQTLTIVYVTKVNPALRIEYTHYLLQEKDVNFLKKGVGYLGCTWCPLLFSFFLKEERDRSQGPQKEWLAMWTPLSYLAPSRYPQRPAQTHQSTLMWVANFEGFRV